MTFKAFINISVLAFFLSILACNNAPKQPEVITIETPNAKNNQAEKTTAVIANANANFTIEGMTCEIGCAKTIESKLNQLAGVKEAKVDFESKQAHVEFNSEELSPDKIEKTITSIAKQYSVHKMAVLEK